MLHIITLSLWVLSSSLQGSPLDPLNKKLPPDIVGRIGSLTPLADLIPRFQSLDPKTEKAYEIACELIDNVDKLSDVELRMLTDNYASLAKALLFGQHKELSVEMTELQTKPEFNLTSHSPETRRIAAMLAHNIVQMVAHNSSVNTSIKHFGFPPLSHSSLIHYELSYISSVFEKYWEVPYLAALDAVTRTQEMRRLEGLTERIVRNTLDKLGPVDNTPFIGVFRPPFRQRGEIHVFKSRLAFPVPKVSTTIVDLVAIRWCTSLQAKEYRRKAYMAALEGLPSTSRRSTYRHSLDALILKHSKVYAHNLFFQSQIRLFSIQQPWYSWFDCCALLTEESED